MLAYHVFFLSERTNRCTGVANVPASRSTCTCFSKTWTARGGRLRELPGVSLWSLFDSTLQGHLLEVSPVPWLEINNSKVICIRNFAYQAVGLSIASGCHTHQQGASFVGCAGGKAGSFLQHTLCVKISTVSSSTAIFVDDRKGP